MFNNDLNKNDAPPVINVKSLAMPKAVLYMILICAVGLLTTYFGGLFSYFIGMIITTALFATIVAKSSNNLIQFSVIITFIVFSLVNGSISTGFFYLMMFVPGGLGFGYAARKRQVFNTAMSYAFVCFIGFALITFLLFTIEKTNPISFSGSMKLFSDYFHNLFGQVYDLLISVVNVPILSSVEKTDFVIDTYSQFVFSLPSLATLFVLAAYSFSFWFFKRLYLLDEDKDNLKNMFFFGKFMYVRINPMAAKVFSVCILISLFALPMGTTNEDNMYFSNLLTILTLIFS